MASDPTQTTICPDCRCPNGWHIGGCENGLLTVAEVREVRSQVREGMRIVREAWVNHHRSMQKGSTDV